MLQTVFVKLLQITTNIMIANNARSRSFRWEKKKKKISISMYLEITIMYLHEKVFHMYVNHMYDVTIHILKTPNSMTCLKTLS